MTQIMRYALCAMMLTMAAPVMAANDVDDYTILSIDGEKVPYSDVLAIWNTLFSGQDTPNFDDAQPQVKRNVMRGVIGEYLLHQRAIAAGIDKTPDVKERLERLRKKLIVEAFLDVKTASAVTPDKVKALYDTRKAEAGEQQEVRASHILVSSKDEADALIKKIKDGQSFAELAKKHSSDSGSAVTGGDLGYFTKDRMVKPFADAAFALEEGAMSEPVKSDFGWHIINVDDKRKASYPPFMQQRMALEAELKGEALKGYIDQLVKASDVVYYAPDGSEQPFDVMPKAE